MASVIKQCMQLLFTLHVALTCGDTEQPIRLMLKYYNTSILLEIHIWIELLYAIYIQVKRHFMSSLKDSPSDTVWTYWGDSPSSMFPIYQELIDAGLRIWVFR